MSRNPYDYYITEEDYALAISNGISNSTLEYRIRSLGWSKQKALTTAVQKHKKYPLWALELAQVNGIPYKTFKNRIFSGWDFETAATRKIGETNQSRKRKYPIEIIELAKKNGISYSNFTKRVNRFKWDVMKAATTPIMSKEQSLANARKKSTFRLGIESFWKEKRPLSKVT
ncbi:hypothetical protein V4V34_09060 [Lysinibacillus sphaericus]|uniref:hypothetical protein n=1 Tax=Lysinibacillus sphaericus TaxID=1421 RepID=UPI0018CC8FE9|nr:hypothetical protein [Lysinibacillus sphaericus]MBG9756377.1 hypothetical protein [Lysinibacillus sphaericus]QTB12602.1 hypothetical protein J2B92_17320 [Lysinibacillus sphaericus]